MSDLIVTAAEYHADPCPQPSLTASIANVLISASPAHARALHPRLNPDFKREEQEKFDIGRAVHSLLLEGDDIAYVILADSWRTNDAKEAREYARSLGRVPLLQKQHEEALAMVTAIREQLAQLDVDPPLFQDGKPEQTITWEEDGVWCRARLDWLHDSKRTIDDLKTCGVSADPQRWQRTMLGMGAHVQARFYSRGIRVLTGHEPEFRFVVAEVQPPHVISLVGLAPSLAALADSQIDYALRTWKRCLASGEWPGYAARVAYVEAPAYEETRWLEREAMEEAAVA